MVSNIVLSAVAWASSLRSTLATRLREDSGQDVIEYAMLVGFIVVAAGIAFLAAGPVDFTTFAQKVADCVSMNKDNCGAPI